MLSSFIAYVNYFNIVRRVSLFPFPFYIAGFKPAQFYKMNCLNTPGKIFIPVCRNISRARFTKIFIKDEKKAHDGHIIYTKMKIMGGENYV